METNTATKSSDTTTDTKDKLTVLNVGVLGHIDSGKTSLCASLSTVLSTAALDKSPQSVERGITLDLQFSAFTLDVPENCSNPNVNGLKKILVSLVDCPGHASLIRTIIGGKYIVPNF
jgi:selenocysteine-specific elongation factor